MPIDTKGVFMKVLIVDQDKSFTMAMSNVLADSKSICSVDVYNEKEEFEQILKEDNVSYDLSFVDVDLIGNGIVEVFKKSPNCKIIGLTSNNKNLNKIINKPIFQRIFHKPVDINDISNYLKLQNKIKFANRHIIDSKMSALAILAELGFNVSHNGTLYLAESICTAISKKINRLNAIYKEVSKDICVNSDLINWSINYAVEQANNGKNYDNLCKFFHIHDFRKVTAKVIIDYFRNNN